MRKAISGGLDLRFSVKDILIKRLVLVCDDRRADGIAGDVYGGSGHIKDTVDTHDQPDRLDRKTDRVEYHCQGDKSDARDACCSDRGESRGADDDQVVGQGQWNIECLCGKYDCHALAI